MSKAEHEAMDCRLDEWREMETVEEGMSHISRDLYGETREALLFGIRSIVVSVTKMEVGRDATGCLGSKSKKWELVVGDA